MRLSAARELEASPADVWALLAEPYHLPDWWPGYVAVRPDRRGVAPGARWGVVRNSAPGLLRRPGGDGLVVFELVEAGHALAWRDLQQGFRAEISLAPAADGTTVATVLVDVPWWRAVLEGLRGSPHQAVSRLGALCQTAAEL